VSATPRTGKNRVRFSTLCHPEDAWWVHETVSAQLEHELNSANDRIKRLEEALREIANQDYRGNRSNESQIAFRALQP